MAFDGAKKYSPHLCGCPVQVQEGQSLSSPSLPNDHGSRPTAPSKIPRSHPSVAMPVPLSRHAGAPQDSVDRRLPRWRRNCIHGLRKIHSLDVRSSATAERARGRNLPLVSASRFVISVPGFPNGLRGSFGDELVKSRTSTRSWSSSFPAHVSRDLAAGRLALYPADTGSIVTGHCRTFAAGQTRFA